MTYVKEDSLAIIFGGINKDNILTNDVLIYDIDSNSLELVDTNGNDKPPVIAYHTATLLNDHKHICIIGGEKDPLSIYSSVYLFNYITGTWKLMIKSSNGIKFSHHTATLISSLNCIFILIHDSLYKLDLNTWKYDQIFTNNTILKRYQEISFYDHTAILVNNQYIYCYGGIVKGKCSNMIKILDINTMKWDIILPQKKKKKKNEEEEDQLQGQQQYQYKDEEELKYSGMIDIIQGDYQLARSQHNAILLYDQYMLIYGGFTSKNAKTNRYHCGYLNDIHIFDCINQQWLLSDRKIAYPLLKSPSAYSTIINLGDKIDENGIMSPYLFIYGGTNSAYHALAEANIFVPAI